MTTEVYTHPPSGALTRVMLLHEFADEADRISTKFKAVLDEMNAERARADAMTREIEGLDSGRSRVGAAS